MPLSSYYIVSQLNGNVIDIREASIQPGTAADAYPLKQSGASNQVWTFVPDPTGSGYFFIQSVLDYYLVLEIRNASNEPGATLDVNLANTAGQTAHQLWTFFADPAGSGYCYILSKLNGYALDIAEASTAPGAALDVFPRKVNGTSNQLWTVVAGETALQAAGAKSA